MWKTSSQAWRNLTLVFPATDTLSLSLAAAVKSSWRTRNKHPQLFPSANDVTRVLKTSEILNSHLRLCLLFLEHPTQHPTRLLTRENVTSRVTLISDPTWTLIYWAAAAVRGTDRDPHMSQSRRSNCWWLQVQPRSQKQRRQQHTHRTRSIQHDELCTSEPLTCVTEEAHKALLEKEVV